MKKLKSYIEKWLAGEKVRGIDVSVCDIWGCVDAYNSIAKKESHEFISGKVKEVLDQCGIKTVECGIGWKIV